MLGRTLSHFVIVEKLGEGGMGVVYKARDTKLDRFVALKILRSDVLANAEHRRRFIQEAKAASALNHPNIITIHDISNDDGIEFIVMEFVPGKSLDQLISRRGMRLSEALKCIVQIADGLAKAHSAGIVHRDIKPSNIVVSNEGRVKILDFGLAKLTETEAIGPEDATLTAAEVRTEEGAILGTVAYMSPEQAQGLTLDHRSDIFSFGSVLYEMVTGQRPFQGGTKIATMSSIIRDDPRPASEVSAGLPRELEKLITRCLRKEPERRVHSMVDVRLALEEIRDESECGNVSPASLVKPKPKHWFYAAGAAVALIAAAGGYYFRSRPEPASGPFRTTVLTSFPGVERDPALSPDGKQVAFSWNGEREDNFDIYVKLVDAGSPVRITLDPAEDVRPRWSPDGRFLAFLRREPDRRSIAYYVVPSLGGQERLITKLIHERQPLFTFPDLDWTQDGKGILISDTTEPSAPLVTVSIDTGEKKRITSPPPKSWGDFSPRLSPDGRRLAFIRQVRLGLSEIMILGYPPKLAEEPVRLIQNSFGERLSPDAWTADGRELIVSGNSGNDQVAPGTISRIMVTRGNPAPIPFLEGANHASVAGVGGRLAYQYEFRDMNLWRVAIGTPKSSAEKLIASTREEYNGRYSADGAIIAYVSGASGSRQIWVANADGSNQRQITTGLPGPADPQFSPDGKLLAFTARPDGNVDIYVVSPLGGAPRRVTNHPDEDANPTWSHDGQWIYFSSNRTGRREVWKTLADGSGSEAQVTRNGGWFHCESPDGKSLFYSKLGERGVWKMPIAGGEESLLEARAFGNSWDLVRDHFYFLTGQKTSLSVERLDLKSGKRETAALLTRPQAGFALSISPDERFALITLVDHEISDLMLIEKFR
jgi:serine/threonine protein kinase/Tol biopolymer transport system component